jgi:hypothetical protein
MDRFQALTDELVKAADGISTGTDNEPAVKTPKAAAKPLSNATHHLVSSIAVGVASCVAKRMLLGRLASSISSRISCDFASCYFRSTGSTVSSTAIIITISIASGCAIIVSSCTASNITSTAASRIARGLVSSAASSTVRS